MRPASLKLLLCSFMESTNLGGLLRRLHTIPYLLIQFQFLFFFLQFEMETVERNGQEAPSAVIREDHVTIDIWRSCPCFI